MKIEIDLKSCKLNELTPDKYVLLYLMYYKEFSKIESLFSRPYATKLKNELQDTKYILSTPDVSFKQTILSTDNVCKLLKIRSENIKFIEFYNSYPVRVGNRILRAADIDTVIGRKHEKKYISKVMTIVQHEEAIKNTKAFVLKQKQSGKLPYLPAMETVINNAMWETWASLVDVPGTEEKEWNEETI
jgi:hypothetical protein